MSTTTDKLLSNGALPKGQTLPKPQPSDKLAKSKSSQIREVQSQPEPTQPQPDNTIEVAQEAFLGHLTESVQAQTQQQVHVDQVQAQEAVETGMERGEILALMEAQGQSRGYAAMSQALFEAQMNHNRYLRNQFANRALNGDFLADQGQTTQESLGKAQATQPTVRATKIGQALHPTNWLQES